MRISRKKLLALARHEAESRAASGDVVSGYVIGSVAASEPLLGNTADIDLVLIHRHEPAHTREMVPLSDEVHLDITHQSSSLYQQPRELRVHPWLGPSMCEPAFLFDPEHFFEWAQAGVRGQFHRADHVHARALAFLDRAREMKAALRPGEAWLPAYLQATLEGANAAATLAGFPAAGRRVMLILEKRLKQLERPSLYEQFLHLLGVNERQAWDYPSWLSSWAKCFDQASRYAVDPELHPCRRNYYLKGLQALVEAGRTDVALWPLLFIWTRALQTLEMAGRSEAHRAPFEQSMQSLELTRAHHALRERQLEDFLDAVEAELEAWAERSGAWPS